MGTIGIHDITDSRLRGMLDLCHSEIDGFKLAFKNESVLMKRLNVFAKIINPGFMTNYTTTIGTTVYFPSMNYLLADQASSAEVLAHELVHMKDQKASWVYTLSYLMPQCFSALALFAFLGFVNPWFLLFLLSLLFLAPIPSPGRRDIEFHGYTMSLAVTYWRKRQILEADIEWAVEQFTSPAYYFMWPFAEDMTHRLKMAAIEIRTGRIQEDPLFRKVYKIFTFQS